jgi:hypothetical protein
MTPALLRRLGTLAAAALCAAPASAQFASASLPAGLTDVGYMAAPALVDVDGDGDLDLFVGRSTGSIAFFENTGTPTAPAFAERTGAANPLDAFTVPAAATIAFGDVFGNGLLDAVVGGINGEVLSLINNGPGAIPQFTGGGGPFYGVPNAAMAFVDVDGDGDRDILSGFADGTITLLRNDGARDNPSAFTLATGAANPLDGVDVGFSAAPTFLDLDSDGALDLLVGDVDGILRFALNTAGPAGPPAFGATADATALGLSDVGYGAVPAAGDLDGDGDLDVIVGRSDGTLAYFVNGSPVLQTTLTGAEGYRELASPVPGALLNDLLSSIHTQGMPGSNYPPTLPNVFVYDETAPGSLNDGFVAPATLAAPAGAGLGYLAYVYADDDPGTPGEQGGFPKTLAVSPGPLVTHLFGWGGLGAPLSYTDTGSPDDDGWNLLGNPFAGWMDWDATAATGLNAPAYVFDAGAAAYLAYSRGVGGTLPGGVIGAFSGFWVQANAPDPTLVADPSPSSGGPVYGRSGAVGPRIALRLTPAAGGPLPDALASQALLALDVPGAQAGVSPLDAAALLPPTGAYVLLGTRALRADGTAATLSIDAREALEGTMEVPLDVRAVGAAEDVALTLAWPTVANIPDGWTLTLRDAVTGIETDLQTADHYAFALDGTASAARSRAPGPQRAGPSDAERFVLVIHTGSVVATAEPVPAGLALAPPRPNPTSGAAWIDLALPDAATVRLDVVDVLGRVVAHVLDEDRPAGVHRLLLPADLAPGVYSVRADVSGTGVSRMVLAQRLVVLR